jgi:hypothetical protein
MRAHELLYEDTRSKLDKLRELIDHPGTEDTVRRVAQGRLELLMASECEVALVPKITVATNITEEDLERQFLTGVPMGDLYRNLTQLSPRPNDIRFLRQGVVNMIVPPPFMGKTRQEYIQNIQSACPGARAIHSQMIEGYGYLFSISYI